MATIYDQRVYASTPYKRKNALRDIAVSELLFSTGMRISELCNLTPSDVNFNDNIVLIHGKGSKERRMQIGNKNVKKILLEYKNVFLCEIRKCNHFFVNQSGTPLSDQTVRRMINKYATYLTIIHSETNKKFTFIYLISKIYNRLINEINLNLDVDYRELWLLENTLCILCNNYLLS